MDSTTSYSSPNQHCWASAASGSHRLLCDAKWGRPFPSHPDADQRAIDPPSDFWWPVWIVGQIIGNSGDVILADGESYHRMPFDATRARGEARQFPNPRIGTAEPDRQMRQTLDG
jgi:hypothetical protein